MKPTQQIISRETSQKILPEIDGMRFLAIFLVASSHLLMSLVKTLPRFDYIQMRKENFLFYAITKGPVGVLIFFCLSGFIIALPYAKQSGGFLNLKRFYIRRFTRITPPYWIALGLAFIINSLIQVKEFQGFDHFFASIFYCHNLVFGTWSNVLPVAWSLEIEIQFYLLAPFILILYFKGNIFVRRSIILLSMLLAPFIQTHFDLKTLHLQQSFLIYFQYFFGGILCADLYVNRPKYNQNLTLVLFILGFTCMAVFTTGGFYYKLGMPFAISMMVMGVLQHEGVKRIFSLNAISKMGVFSYSIYLLHYPILYVFSFSVSSFFQYPDFATTFLIQALISFPITLLLSMLFFVLIEKPFMSNSGPLGYFKNLVKWA